LAVYNLGVALPVPNVVWREEMWPGALET
jgi:hypothetical protein